MDEWNIARRLWYSFAVGLLLIALYVFSVRVDFCNLYGGMPSTALLENPQNELASELYSADGVLLGKYFRNNRSSVQYHEIAPTLIQALIASEDYRFEQHAGIDPIGLARAFLLSILLQRKKGGGSTLTQQLAKNLFNTRGEMDYRGKLSNVPLLGTLSVKTKEWILAVQLERAYTKHEILAMYLNTVSFGSNTYGIKVAARTFFNKSPAELRVEEAALLVGILRAPTYYSPMRHPERAKHIRRVVLGQMLKYQFLTPTEYNLLAEAPLELHYKEENYERGAAPYFRAVVRDFLLKWTKENGYDLFSDGLRIYTTIDSLFQKHAESALKNHMALLQSSFDAHWEGRDPWANEQGEAVEAYLEKEFRKTALYKKWVDKYGSGTAALEQAIHTPVPTQLFSWQGPIQTLASPFEAFKYHRKILQAGCLAMDPHTGHIKAWVGGIDYKFFKYDHVKQSKRQAGSTFKPIVYTVALDNGYLPTDLVVDEPVSFVEPNGRVWTAQNAWKSYSGQKRTLRYAMAQSYNSITAHLMKQLTPQLVVKYARCMGIQGPLDPVPALCLGTGDVSVYEMVGAYSTFLNKGVWTEPHFITYIEDKHGNVLQTFSPQRQEAIHPDTADLMTYMLQGALEEGVLNRVAKELKENNDLAGKSGTTSDHSDGWFIGLTQNLCVGVWVGGEDRCVRFREYRLGSGSATARPIWEQFLLNLYRDPQTGYAKGPLVDASTLSEKVQKTLLKCKGNNASEPGREPAAGASVRLPAKPPAESVALDVEKIY